MKIKSLVISGIVAVGLFVAGWAVAQSTDHRHGGNDEQRGFGMHRQNGHGMQGQNGPSMHGKKGRGMQGQGAQGMMGMNHGNATAGERGDIHSLFFNHEKIKRTVTNLSNGIRTVTESDDPELAQTIRQHVADMGKRVEDGRNPRLPIQSPTLNVIFKNKDKIKSVYEVTEKGIIVVQTSTDAETIKALQQHAAEVTDLADRGIVAAHEGMKNRRGMIGHGMRGASAEMQHQH